LEKLNTILNIVCLLEGVERTNSSIILDTVFERESKVNQGSVIKPK
jgi:hypothetical protein